MTISKENKVFLEGLIEYYISEAQSYREMAQEYSLKIDSVPDTSIWDNSRLHLFEFSSNIF